MWRRISIFALGEWVRLLVGSGLDMVVGVETSFLFRLFFFVRMMSSGILGVFVPLLVWYTCRMKRTAGAFGEIKPAMPLLMPHLFLMAHGALSPPRVPTSPPPFLPLSLPIIFDPSGSCIQRDLNLKRPIMTKTAAYGHFGRNDPDFTWEQVKTLEI